VVSTRNALIYRALIEEQDILDFVNLDFPGGRDVNSTTLILSTKGANFVHNLYVLSTTTTPASIL
jgi:hypothetical protein